MTDSQRELLIIGAGGYGREILSYIEDGNQPFRFKGFLDNREDVLTGISRILPVVGDPLTYAPLANEAFVAALGDPLTRHKYTAPLREIHQADFVTVTHPGANINRHAEIRRGCMIGPRVGISVDVQIGEFTHIQEYTVVGHDARIGDWCQINSHCTIAGGARIGNFVTIHPNCVVTNRAVIGDGATIAPGSVVIGRIPPGITVLGNPARRFSFR